jgi:hypothetical protein
MLDLSSHTNRQPAREEDPTKSNGSLNNGRLGESNVGANNDVRLNYNGSGDLYEFILSFTTLFSPNKVFPFAATRVAIAIFLS